MDGKGTSATNRRSRPGIWQHFAWPCAASDDRRRFRTAPNRRYVDFVTQRLLKAAMLGMSQPYGKETLDRIAARCTERETAANKVERLMRKIAAADMMAGRVGEIFPAIVTGASPKGTWVRLIPWPAEGKVVRREQGLDVGDHVEVRLVEVDRARGFIDFERVR